jgi:SAM-dependent methyltransferase
MITWEEAVEQLRRDPAQAELIRSCYYDDPLKAAAERFAAGEEWAAVRALLPAPAKVLELGAGRGISSYAFAKAGWKVTALEPDASDVVGAGAIRSLAQDAGVAIEVVENWGESLPFPGGTFDLVYGRAVFHHARDLEAFCAEACRVLKPGGKVLLTREHVLTAEDDLRQFLDRHPLHRLYGGEAAYTLARYTGALESAGLKVTRIIGPKSSPINFFPETAANITAALRARRRKRIGWFRDLLAGNAAGSLAEERQLWEGKMRVPGRLYSFLADKIEKA